MASLPSYAEATTRPDWVPWVASHVDPKDYYALCLVSRRFWDAFAPRLWRDLLVSVRRVGVDPSDGMSATSLLLPVPATVSTWRSVPAATMMTILLTRDRTLDA
jgi:hypothetical protein